MNKNHYIDTNRSLSLTILASLAYFEVFSHPLNFREIMDFSRIPACTGDAVEAVLRRLIDGGFVHEKDGFYFLGDDPGVVASRVAANRMAQKRMRSAKFYSGVIARFPFVRAVFISGSLSKGVMDTEDDIDFFIVTEPGRLWVARMLLTLFKRTFLLNSHRNFCLNYFIDTSHFAIPEQNIFTATEIGLILPMYNSNFYHRFLDENSWYRYYYPNLAPLENVGNMPEKPVATIIEKILSGPSGNRLDDFCLRLTRSFLARKYQNMDPVRFDNDLETSKGVSRHHPNRQQFKVLNRYIEILDGLESRLQMLLPDEDVKLDYDKSA